MRIIILMHYMELGGAEMALTGLLSALDPARVDTDLFVYSHQGPLMNHIPEWVHLLPEVGAYAAIERPAREALKCGHIGVVAGRALGKLAHRWYRKRHPAKGDDISMMQYAGEYVTPWLPDINPEVEYDLCISFLTPHYIGRDKVRARKRIAWIHTDYATVSVNAHQELPVWAAYDHIASISPEVTRSFLSVFPSLEDKIIEIENILPENYIRSSADLTATPPEMEGGGLKLLTIGRYSYPKNFDNLPHICAELLKLLPEEKRNLKWYVIGYGGCEDQIRRHIADAGMEEHVVLLGKKENPYPYIKACDVYVQPSRYEGKSITVREAQILGKPVVVTNYPTAPSQIHSGTDGVIVPLDNSGCARGIADFLTDTDLRERIATNLREGDFANASEVEKVYGILGV